MKNVSLAKGKMLVSANDFAKLKKKTDCQVFGEKVCDLVFGPNCKQLDGSCCYMLSEVM